MTRKPNPDWEGANIRENAGKKGTEPAGLDVDDGRIERREAEEQIRAREKKTASRRPPKPAKEEVHWVKTDPVALGKWKGTGMNPDWTRRRG